VSAVRQTIYVRPDATAYVAVCEECLADRWRPPGSGSPLAEVRGSLRLEADVGFTCCRRGHRLRVRRVARPADSPRPVPLRYGYS
jgi:hypothetical protein